MRYVIAFFAVFITCALVEHAIETAPARNAAQFRSNQEEQCVADWARKGFSNIEYLRSVCR
jgi:hypothetical protein